MNSPNETAGCRVRDFSDLDFGPTGIFPGSQDRFTVAIWQGQVSLQGLGFKVLGCVVQVAWLRACKFGV